MDRAGFWLYRLVARGLAALTLEAAFRLGEKFGALAYLLAVPYRQLVLRNLEIAFGAEQSEEELRALARKHFATLGGNLFASIKLPQLSREEILNAVEVEGLEALAACRAAGRGAVMVISHLGNWEMFAQLSPLVFGCPVGTIYQALGNRFFDQQVRLDRARLGLALFERKEGFTAAAKFLREGGAVGVLADQHAGDGGLWCPFFNRLASTSTLAATLALRTGAALLPSAVFTDGAGRWRCVLRPEIVSAGKSVPELTAEVNRTLEQQIRQQPEDWFWVHNRWKLPRPKFLLATYKRGLFIPRKAAPVQRLRLVVRSSNWLGDAVMSVPAVRAIKRGRPDAHVTVLAPAKLADLWRAIAEVDDVISIEAGENVFAVARKIRGFEAAIVLPNSLRTALEPWLAGIPRRVGFPGHRRSWLLNQICRPKKRKKDAPAPPPLHHTREYLRLAEFVGAEVPAAEISAPRPPKTPRVIGLCAGAEYGPAKRWLPERFAETMQRVAAEEDCEWVLFGVAKDAAIGAEITRDFTGRFRNRIGQTTLAELMAELRACDLLLTNDTGAMHLAALLGVPTVSIFGSTEPALTKPLGAHHRILRHHVPCSPCFLRECPLDFRCMRAVETEEVVGAVLQSGSVRAT